MASFDELSTLLEKGGDQGLRGKVQVATLIACDDIRLLPDDPSDDDLQRKKRFAQSVLGATGNISIDKQAAFERVYRMVLIQNRTNSVAQITGANDAQIQTAVDTAVDFFAAAYPAPTGP